MSFLPLKTVQLPIYTQDNGLPQQMSDRPCFVCSKPCYYLSLHKCFACAFALCHDCITPYITQSNTPFRIVCPLCINVPHSGIFPPIHVHKIAVTTLTKLGDLNNRLILKDSEYKDLERTNQSLNTELMRLREGYDALKQQNDLYTKRFSSWSESSTRTAETIKQLKEDNEKLKEQSVNTNKRKRSEKPIVIAEEKKKRGPKIGSKRCKTCRRNLRNPFDECVYCSRVCNICSTSYPIGELYCEGCDACFCFSCKYHYNSKVHDSCPFCTDTE